MNELPVRLALQTAFEAPVPPLPVPGTLTAGNRPELLVADKVARGVALLGRYGATPALFGLKVRPSGGAVRVTVRFSIDKASVDWWEARAPQHLENRDPDRGRLFLVRSQGATRVAVYLMRRPQDDAGGVTRGEARFDLPPDELDEAGLLIVEVQSVDRVPSWARQQLAPFAPIGVRIDAVDLAPVDPDAGPLVHQLSVGGPAPAGSPASPVPAASAARSTRAASVAPPLGAEVDAVALRSDLFVASPGAPAPARWTLRVRLTRPLGRPHVDLDADRDGSADAAPDGSDESTLAEGPAGPAPAVAASDVSAAEPAANAPAPTVPTPSAPPPPSPRPPSQAFAPVAAATSGTGGGARSIARLLLWRPGRSNRTAAGGASSAPAPAHPSHAGTADVQVDAAMSLTELLEDLLGRNRFRVEAVGLSGAWVPEPSLVVRAVEPAAAATPSTPVVTELAEVDVDLGDTLPEPVLVGVQVDPGAVHAVPGFGHATLTWELLVPKG